MAQRIIGRDKEKKELQNLFSSQRAEFVIVQGRRRVGKTFLIRELFSDDFAFYHTGLSPFELQNSIEKLLNTQLYNFYSSLLRYGYSGLCPNDWIQAFDALIELLNCKKAERLVVFIDELPWMDTPRSGFLTAFEHFWNGWGAGQSKLMLIVCGSSSSWVSDKIINNKGGLYNRATYEIKLLPLNLKECEDFYKDRGVSLNRYDQIQSYMVFGGIPYYISLFQKGKSLAQNIDSLCFVNNGILRNEFNRLFYSIFTNAEDCIKIVRFLNKKKKGCLRKEIAEGTNIAYGGGLTNSLKALEESNIICSYIPYNQSSRKKRYKLVDSFCLFYLQFMEEKTNNEHFWQDNLLSSSLNTWRGYAFENVCFKHINQIKRALGISGVQCEISSWRGSSGEESAQIDMVIDRADRVINICEIKFYGDDFRIDKDYDKVLRRKIEIFSSDNTKHKSLYLTLITTFGIIQNEYSGSIQNVIILDDLF